MISRSDLGQYTVCVYDSVGGGEGDVSNCKPNFTDVSDMGRCHLGLLWGGQTVADFCLSRDICHASSQREHKGADDEHT